MLIRCLLRLVSVPGADPERTLVVADGDLQGRLREVRALVILYGMKVRWDLFLGRFFSFTFETYDTNVCHQPFLFFFFFLYLFSLILVD